ncbi:MFS transporter [Nostoc sp. CENA67]|uniref:MFS transporter n=1 Tax=Amazonocrinis nigriterrae CENA67 TaxID=2794033 RepID=A0A8J7HPN3_9NOST|nr:MFS transporter [Amazonocrinis nigriterrae]MBH8561825.1 MFS transporter [Amazonocrinis nigriterrae CENA67]
MQTFIIIWLGQMISLIGSTMTAFAFSIWVWELTHQATALALFHLFAQIPQFLITPIAGVIVDKINRKFLMIVGDTAGGLLTFSVFLLYLTDSLQLWHLYVAFAAKCTFEQFQELAYSASISTIVPQQKYSHASSLSFLAGHGSLIIAPALAGILYGVIGLFGILIIDIISFLVAIVTVLRMHIPQPAIAESITPKPTNIIQDMSFGFKYIISQPNLLALLVLTAIFWLIHDIGDSVYKPMILAASGNDASVLGSLYAAAGVGGVLGVLLINIYPVSKSRIKGILFGMIGTALGRIILGLGRTPVIWIPAQLYSSLNYPLLGSYSDAIWLAKVQPQLQGRVFATKSMILLLTSALANLIGGPLTDRVFEPAMMPQGSLAPIFGSIFGTRTGAGSALLYVISAVGLLLVGLSGYAFRNLHGENDQERDR